MGWFKACAERRRCDAQGGRVMLSRRLRLFMSIGCTPAFQSVALERINPLNISSTFLHRFGGNAKVNANIPHARACAHTPPIL